METVRRTVTMPAQLAAGIDAAVADDAADSISALLATAARRYLDQLTDDRITTHAARLEPDTELAIIRRASADTLAAAPTVTVVAVTADHPHRTSAGRSRCASPPTPAPRSGGCGSTSCTRCPAPNCHRRRRRA